MGGLPISKIATMMKDFLGGPIRFTDDRRPKDFIIKLEKKYPWIKVSISCTSMLLQMDMQQGSIYFIKIKSDEKTIYEAFDHNFDKIKFFKAIKEANQRSETKTYSINNMKIDMPLLIEQRKCLYDIHSLLNEKVQEKLDGIVELLHCIEEEAYED